MNRSLVLVEGVTEEIFLNEVVGRYLFAGYAGDWKCPDVVCPMSSVSAGRRGRSFRWSRAGDEAVTGSCRERI